MNFSSAHHMMAIMKHHSIPHSRNNAQKVPSLIFIDTSECSSSSSDDETLLSQSEAKSVSFFPQITDSNKSNDTPSSSCIRRTYSYRLSKKKLYVFIIAELLIRAGELLANNAIFEESRLRDVVNSSIYLFTNLLPLYGFIIVAVLCRFGGNYQQRSFNMSRIFDVNKISNIRHSSARSRTKLEKKPSHNNKPNLGGKYKLVESSNKDQFLKSAGLSWAKRKIVGLVDDVSITIYHNNVIGDISVCGETRLFSNFTYYSTFLDEWTRSCPRFLTNCEFLPQGKGIMAKIFDTRNKNEMEVQMKLSPLEVGNIYNSQERLIMDIKLMSHNGHKTFATLRFLKLS
mmetsp:Transcript_26251/g.32191  ORF Transcript_26251/g.32191 Transcript_26251/m.32191 type:complete len:343 (-) Transcript_26251:16-1044(-)